ncbi:hypothetical protein P43SY_003827 [Pythium insidiosum]|uniref:ABC transmembrane type-1 domain-containing protein n=1 Tax=Pythium insidiosum TaxID=114742 RepID=A0AAD5LRB8_PYTIN|nr:hypothetical protein P43SY_003827 [Pythium insidiosum]
MPLGDSASVVSMSLLDESGTRSKARYYSTFAQPTPTSTPPTGYHQASWLSRLFFLYVNPVIETGRQRQLNMDDLWGLHEEDQAQVVFERFRRVYRAQQQSIVRAILVAYGKQFLLCGLGSLTMAGCAVFAPVVLNRVIDVFSAPSIDMRSLLLWVLAFASSRIINGLCEAHVNFNLQVTIIRLTVSLKCLLFEKATRRSVQSKNDNDSVDVSNLLTADMESLLWAGSQINAAWVVPIHITVVIFMLYNVLEQAAFAGVGVIVGTMYLNYVVAKEYNNSYNDIMELKDVRMRSVKEVFGAIYVIKLNAWEQKSLERIMSWRHKEMKAIVKYLYMIALALFLFRSSPVCVAVVSFATYALVLGKSLTPAKVFTAMALFNSIRDPLSTLPDTLQAIIQAYVALQRMQKFMDSEEVHPERISRDVENYPEDVMISVENATFTWESTPKENKSEEEGEEPKESTELNNNASG